MRELRLHHELYSLPAVQKTLKVFSGAGRVELHQEMPHYRVEIVGETREREAELAGELGNYALALTVEERRTVDPGGHR